MSIYRPPRITAIAIALIILALLGVIPVIIITALLLPREYALQSLEIWRFIWFQSFPASQTGGPLTGADIGIALSNVNATISALYLATVVFPILSVIGVLVEYDWLRMKK